MIQLKRIKKKYKNKLLFANVNVELSKPGMYFFQGDNGVGKTTFLNIIAKVVKPTKGKIVNKHKTIFVSQNIYLIENVKVKDYFQMFNVNVEVLKKYHLYTKKDSFINQLSFGQKQRIICILAIYSKNEVLLLDEPTSHLDKYNASLIMNALKKVSKEKIVMIISHNKNDILKYSDAIYEIKDYQVSIKKANSSLYKLIKNKPTYKLSKYKKHMFKNSKKSNIAFFVIYFLISFILSFTVNLKSNFNNYIDESINNSLDYNKFYLKECEMKEQQNLIIKKCFNISESKKEILKKLNYEIYNNYDVLLNSIYEINNFNIIKGESKKLKEGRYPLKYNEIIVSDNYRIGDKITLEASKLIGFNKKDIFCKKLELEVVGIINQGILKKDNNYYLDYNLVENYLKQELLINNGVSLYEYFNELEIDNYKYLLYFEDIDLDVLKNNEIDYLSSSYDYYNSLKSTVDKVVEIFKLIEIIVVISSIYYLIKLTNKKIKMRENDFLFFKSIGLKKNKIKKLMFYEYHKLIIEACVISNLLVLILLKIISKDMVINVKALIITYLFIFFLTKLIFLSLMKWRKRI